MGWPFQAVGDGLKRPSYGLGLIVGLIVTAADGEIASAQGTAVQLPTYRTFTSSTTVSVPDRGSAYLGGVNRARSGSNEFGTPLAPFRSRASGSERSASGTSVSVYIHDFAAMEEELLGAAAGSGAPRRGRAVAGSRAAAGSPDPATRTTDGLQQRWGDLRSASSAGSGDPRRALADPPLPSIEEIRRQRLLDREARQSESRDFFERGQVAEASGKANVACIYYQMAARRASGSFRDEVLARLDSLRRGQMPKVARTEP